MKAAGVERPLPAPPIRTWWARTVGRYFTVAEHCALAGGGLTARECEPSRKSERALQAASAKCDKPGAFQRERELGRRRVTPTCDSDVVRRGGAVEGCVCLPHAPAVLRALTCLRVQPG